MATLTFLHPEHGEVLKLLADLIRKVSCHLLRIVLLGCHMTLTYVLSSLYCAKLMI